MCNTVFSKVLVSTLTFHITTLEIGHLLGNVVKSLINSEVLMRIELDSHVIHKFYLLMENVEKNNKKDFSTYELRVSSFLIDQCYPLFLRDTFKG